MTAQLSCEYYGYLPKLTRRSASPLTSTNAPQVSATQRFSSEAGAAPVKIQPFSLYTATRPLTCKVAELPPKPAASLRMVIISDTHERHREMKVPNGDILVHCGDIQEGVNFFRSVHGMLDDFAAWLNDPVLHPHPVKLLIAGNHDKAIAGMKREAVRRLFAPALYLDDESAVIEPIGLRFYGSPRSIANSCFSPNTAFQSKMAWRPFMFAAASLAEEAADMMKLHATEVKGSQVSVRLEGEVPWGPVDVLVTHQSPDTSHGRHTAEKQPISTYVQQVAPRRAHLCGHLHDSHGLHRLPVPLAVQEVYGVTPSPRDSSPSVADPKLMAIPFLPSINASMMIGMPGHGKLLAPSVVDLEI